MKVILQEDVEKLGKAGDIVTVKDGYARNFLIPRKLAVTVSSGNLKALEFQKKAISKRIEKRSRQAEELLKVLENHSVTIAKQAGKDDRLYGSVTQKDIEAALLEENIKVDRKQILLEEPIKTLGIFPVKIKIDKEKQVEIKVWVVAQ
jgi:large subunit ribosomal protein L9